MTKNAFSRIRTASVCIIMILLLFGLRVEAKENSLQKGSWSLQFEVSGDFRLSGFQGTIFSLKRQYSERSAVRIGMSLDASTADEDSDAERVNVNRYISSAENNADRENVEVVGQYIYYPSPGNDVNLFFGLGPHVRYSRVAVTSTTYSSIPENNLSTGSRSETRNSSWAFGGATAMGIEWFFLKKLSLLAEYGAYLDYAHTSGNRITSPLPDSTFARETSHRDSFALTPLAVKLGLAFYFK